jgi:Tol biopolymer transport system component
LAGLEYGMGKERSLSVRQLGIAVAASALVLGAGVGIRDWWIDRQFDSPVNRSPNRARRTRPRTPTASETYKPLSLADLKQTNSGPGLVVCDPHVEPASKSVAAFGMGCAAWLQLHAAGQAEFGKTPRHQSIVRGQMEMGRATLDLRPDELPRFGRIMGITHVALGSISGTPQQCKLRYQLYTTEDGKPFGEPLELFGSGVVVTEQLPEMARSLAMSLGASKPAVPPEMGETAADLAWIGQCPWPAGRVLTPAESKKLQAMRPYSALALLYLALSEFENLEVQKVEYALYQLSEDLVNRAPQNTIAVAEAVMTLNEKRLNPAFANAGLPIQKLLANHPNHYLLHSALSYELASGEGSLLPAWRESAEAVRAATHNPDAWRWLAKATDALGSASLSGGYQGNLDSAPPASDAELAVQSTRFWKRVVEVDPWHYLGWVEVASQAARHGDRTGVKAALQKACSLPYSRFAGYARALELYGPYYLRDEAARRSYAQRMVKEDWHTSPGRVATATALHQAGYADLAKQVLRDETDRKGYRRWHLAAVVPASVQVVPPNTPAPGAPDGLPVPSSAPFSVLMTHDSGVSELAWSPDGSRLATGSWDRTVRILNPGDGRQLLMVGHTNAITDVEWQPAGDLVASVANDASIRIWDARTGRERRKIAWESSVGEDGPVSQVAWSPDGKTLAAVGRRSARLFESASGKKLRELEGPGTSSTTLRFSRDGARLMMNRWDRMDQPNVMLQVWDLKANTPRYIGHPAAAATAVAWSPNEAKVATGTVEGQLSIWDGATGRELHSMHVPTRVNAVAWHPGGHLFASAGVDRQITLWNADTGKMVYKLLGNARSISSLAWHPSGKRLVSGSDDGRVLGWDLTRVLPVAER